MALEPKTDPSRMRAMLGGQAPGSPGRTSHRRRHRHPIAFTVLIVVALLVLLPMAALAINALTPSDQMRVDEWLPSRLRWHNFADAVKFIPFWRLTRNSIVLATLSAVLTTFSSAMAGYGFARLRGPGKKFLFTVLIGTMMLPPIVTLIPTYILFSRVHLVGTYWPWVLWGAAGAPYAIFLYRQFFAGFPVELEEAAILDGAGRVRIFLQIFLPLSHPLLVTSFVLAFNAVWGDFIAPNLFLNQSNTTLAVGVSSGYVNSHGYPVYNLLAAGALLYVVPVVVLFLFAQRSYVQGLVNTGIK
jgi:multiple sugar transport system permease protein